jgi:hypothetical protein
MTSRESNLDEVQIDLVDINLNHDYTSDSGESSALSDEVGSNHDGWNDYYSVSTTYDIPSALLGRTAQIQVGAIGSTYLLQNFLGITFGKNYTPQLTSEVSVVSDQSYESMKARAKRAYSKVSRNKRARLNVSEMNALLTFGCSTRYSTENCFHVGSLDTPSMQQRLAPFVCYLKSIGYTDEQILEPSTKVKNGERLKTVPSAVAVAFRTMLNEFVSYNLTFENEDSQCMLDYIIERFELNLRRDNLDLMFWKDKVPDVFVDIRMFCRMLVAWKCAHAKHDVTGMQRAIEGAVHGAMFTPNLSMDSYSYVISDPLSGNFQFASEVRGIKRTVSDDITICTSGVMKNGAPLLPRRGLGSSVETIWMDDALNVNRILEHPPVPYSAHTAMHHSMRSQSPHIRVYRTAGSNVWLPSGDRTCSFPPLLIDMFIALMSSLWAMHVSRSKDRIIIDGIDTGMPRPYEHVLAQLSGNVKASFVLTLYFALRFNMCIPDDIFKIWDDFCGGTATFDKTWGFIMSPEHCALVTATRSYQFIHKIRDKVIAMDRTPISGVLYSALQATDYPECYYGYAVIEHVEGEEADEYSTFREWHYVEVEQETWTEYLELQQPLSSNSYLLVVVTPASNMHTFIRLKLENDVYVYPMRKVERTYGMETILDEDAYITAKNCSFPVIYEEVHQHVFKCNKRSIVVLTTDPIDL